MTVTAGCDPRALRIAQELHRSQQPEITILFGSRARGDYVDGQSDIDVLLVRESVPDFKQKERIDRKAQKVARSLYGWPVPVQTVWCTRDEFDQMRRTVNHVVARALQDGVIMPQDPEEYGNRYGQDEPDLSNEWTVTSERLRHAEQHLAVFDMLANSDRPLMDDMIGLHAHQALEHAMKAVISARGRQYKTTHNLNELVGDVRRADPEFRFRLTIDGQIYNQYAGRDEYRPTKSALTGIPNYEEATRADVQRLLERVREIQGGQQSYISHNERCYTGAVIEGNYGGQGDVGVQGEGTQS